MPPPARLLEPSAGAMQALADRVVGLALASIEGLADRPVGRHLPPETLLAEALAPPPETGEDVDALLDLVRRASEYAYQPGPGHFAYIPSSTLLASALADLLGAALNGYTGKVLPAPALVALEESVLRWLCGLFAFPGTAQALLTTGGSASNLIALVAARTRLAEGASDRATVYVGEHAHGSIAKAARTAGLARAHVRTVRSDAALRLDPAHLRECIARDRAAGLVPVCVCAAAGTTNTGTVDPLHAVADVAAEHGLWYHVDGAYGGLFQLTARGRERLAGIERADSIALDPHKSLFVPFGSGAVVVRDRAALHAAFAEQADYMQDLDGEAPAALDALPDFDVLSPELTRSFRGLRLWLPLHLYGVAAFRDALDEKLDLAALAYEVLSQNPRLDVPRPPDLSIVAFRLAGGDEAAQRRLLDRINATQRVLLSSTRLGGQTYLRLAVLSVRTHEDRLREALQIIAHAAEAEG